jgi:hypothetical protein
VGTPNPNTSLDKSTIPKFALTSTLSSTFLGEEIVTFGAMARSPAGSPLCEQAAPPLAVVSWGVLVWVSSMQWWAAWINDSHTSWQELIGIVDLGLNNWDQTSVLT